MTQAIDITDIVKPLGWSAYDTMKRTEYACWTINGQALITPDCRTPTKCRVRIGGYKRPELYNSIKEAQDDVFRFHCSAIKRRLDLDNLQTEPEPFWKPIEQCPKTEGVNYLCCNNDGDIHISEFISGYSPIEGEYSYWESTSGYTDENDCYTHYAEIPPLPDTQECQP